VIAWRSAGITSAAVADRAAIVEVDNAIKRQRGQATTRSSDNAVKRQRGQATSSACAIARPIVESVAGPPAERPNRRDTDRLAVQQVSSAEPSAHRRRPSTTLR
jgi:hypothetical protein